MSGKAIYFSKNMSLCKNRRIFVITIFLLYVKKHVKAPCEYRIVQIVAESGMSFEGNLFDEILFINEYIVNCDLRSCSKIFCKCIRFDTLK